MDMVNEDYFSSISICQACQTEWLIYQKKKYVCKIDIQLEVCQYFCSTSPFDWQPSLPMASFSIQHTMVLVEKSSSRLNIK
jgi:hypothetical protein